MSLNTNGLSKYNPLLCSEGYEEFECYSSCLSIFSSFFKQASTYDIEFLHLPYRSILKQYSILEELIVYCNQNLDSDIANYSKNFEKLLLRLNELSMNYSEQFWDYLHTLVSILLKVSVVRECRQLITDNLQAILAILKFAVIKEQELSKNGASVYYRIAYFFVANKFKNNSSIDDDDLMRIAKEQCMPTFSANTFSILAQYKNCNKCDLSVNDLIKEFECCKKDSNNSFWIYAYYAQKYKKLLESFFLDLQGDSIYDCWFSYVLSKEFYERTKDLSLEELKALLTEELNAFSQAGIYTYEATLLITKMCKERS